MTRSLSAFAVWGLSFGFAVGWGAFVMPGAAFLPDAGPAGTLVGVEAVSHSSSEFRFPARRLWWILLAAISSSAAMYAMLAVMPVLSHPAGYATWVEYLGARVGLSGLDSMPTFAAAHGALGRGGDTLDALARMGCDVETTLRNTYTGDRAFYVKMLGRLNGSTALARMRGAFEAGDAAALFSASHNLKGVYASLGLTPLHALCGEIVEIARAGWLDGVGERLERLEKMHAEVLETISVQQPHHPNRRQDP